MQDMYVHRGVCGCTYVAEMLWYVDVDVDGVSRALSSIDNVN